MGASGQATVMGRTIEARKQTSVPQTLPLGHIVNTTDGCGHAFCSSQEK
ncbi:hypothetical protein SAMN04489740_4051 [Arthrobacter alpinus]|uniref:Uncharacterized protein n=1 Tax=Arthrobacter alpinus TaxID=656366 RepID=A0A1H5PB59_9MICC|nr:hypothetical protein SAMN04489740_4051 [Arthrobacter alpinus]